MSMLKNPATKYRSFAPVGLKDRTWPDKVITHPPIWCSVDLRDGNQALIEPMDRSRKLRMFETLCKLGFKEIEAGFPSASQTDFDFIRFLIEEDRIPEDVTIQVLTQAREPLIERTFESLRGARRAIVHYYNAVAPVMRRVVFNLSKAEVISQLAVEVWAPTAEQPCIINLPATIEHSTPNIFADMVEWMHRNLQRRDAIVLSAHPHNDRGTGTAAAEFAMMAGADRVEGCLFGNGERTGNVDVVNLALNMYSQGIHPGLDFSDIDEVRQAVEFCNQLPVHPRHPYVGDLVFTSFSGSHQDAIKKAFHARKEGDIWDMPYLPIDPMDLGRSYEAVIRVNSQSGKGGISYLLEAEYGLSLPRRLQIEFSQVVQSVTDVSGKEVSASDIWEIFSAEYLQNDAPYQYVAHHLVEDSKQNQVDLTTEILMAGQRHKLAGNGNGPIDAFVQALGKLSGEKITVSDYHEHAISKGADAEAVTYIELRVEEGRSVYGVGIDSNIVTASLKAILGGLNRLARKHAAPVGADNRAVA